ncbi:MAG: DUF1365 domain-containing protein [Arenicella sp.]
MSHSVYEGVVIHERQQPRLHRFQYTVFQPYIDLDEIDTLNQLSRLWSVNRFNLVQFKRSDYMTGDDDLKTAVIECIHTHTQEHFQGKIYLLTNLRYWGYCFNPVSFYFCYADNKDNSENPTLTYIVAEINNTPWDERHAYVLDVATGTVAGKTDTLRQDSNESSHINDTPKHKLRFDFDKVFHVSPFMPMDLQYRWFFTITEKRINIHMELYRETSGTKRQRQFFATMNLQGQSLNRQQANRLPFRYPMLCLKIFSAIHWQALKLWCKRIPFINHPNKT